MVALAETGIEGERVFIGVKVGGLIILVGW